MVRILLLILVIVAIAASSHSSPTSFLPSRITPSQKYVGYQETSLRLHKVIRFIEIKLRKQKILFTRKPTFSYRGIYVSRFLLDPGGPVMAIHLFREKGMTYIYLVPNAPVAPSQ